ncbi:unnamed protein product, partial [Allacma fusca]
SKVAVINHRGDSGTHHQYNIKTSPGPEVTKPMKNQVRVSQASRGSIENPKTQIIQVKE